MKQSRIISITAAVYGKLLLAVLGTDRGGCKIKDTEDRTNVAIGEVLAWKSYRHLPSNDGESHFGEFPIVDANCPDEKSEDARESICAGKRVIEPAGLKWWHWTGSSWEIDDIASDIGVNATREGGAAC